MIKFSCFSSSHGFPASAFAAFSSMHNARLLISPPVIAPMTSTRLDAEIITEVAGEKSHDGQVASSSSMHCTSCSRQTEPKEAVLDKSMFDSWLKLLALRVPKQQCSLVSKILSGYLLDRPRLKHIVPDLSSPSARLVLLSESISDPSLCEIPYDKLAAIKSLTEVEVVPHNILLDYTYWSVDQVLKEILPTGSEVPSSFETIGHIAHLNLRDELLPYQKIIAKVILDKNQPKVQTVVNKIGTICNEFRVPTFEVLAGKKSLVTEVKQHGATFQLDYGLVYWNSRLEFEHKRLVSQFQPGQVVCDMFAGIGPFAIPAARQGCTVFANDLNPESTKYLQMNATINKVRDKVHIFNMDAREFMRELMIYKDGNFVRELDMEKAPAGLKLKCCVEEHYLWRRQEWQYQQDHLKNSTYSCSENIQGDSNQGNGKIGKHSKPKSLMNSDEGSDPKPWEHVDHIIMNLPASALEFLDVFPGLLSRTHWKGKLPQVHCYCFMRSNETTKDILQRAEETLKFPITEPYFWTVRDVAPNKIMLCLSFKLPEEAAFTESVSTDETLCQVFSTNCFQEAAMKKPRVDC